MMLMVMGFTKPPILIKTIGRPMLNLGLWTTPAAVMTAADAADLHQVAGSALERLTGELSAEARRRIRARLAEAVRAAEHSPTDHGLAVFVRTRFATEMVKVDQCR
jgi:hypothetical protein